jgi:hypothetical protein
MTGLPSINGPNVICEAGEFTLFNNLVCDKDISWVVEPGGLFNSATTGVGNIASVSVKPNANGNAVITYFLTSDGCNDIEIDHEFLVGSPCPFDLFIQRDEVCEGETWYAWIGSSNECLNDSQITWNFSGAITGMNNSSRRTTYTGISNGIGRICITVTNECGSRTQCEDVIVNLDDCGPIRIRENYSTNNVTVYPNPAKDFIKISLGNKDETRVTKARIYTTTGLLVHESAFYESNFDIDLMDFSTGLYILEIDVDGVPEIQKIYKL